MVATLIRLKKDLTFNGFNQSGWHILGTVFAGLYGLGIVGMVFSAQVMAGGAEVVDSQFIRTSSVLMGSAVFLLWLIIPVFISGADAAMNPRQFITYGIPRRGLILGLALTGLVSIGAVLTLIWLIGQVLHWRWDPAAVATALLTLPLLLITFSLVSQAVTTSISAWLSGRRSRDFLAILALSLMVMLYPIMVGLQNAFSSLSDAVPSVVDFLALTPLGAGAALPADAAAGHWGAFALRVGILAATVALAVLVIRTALVKITERPAVHGSSGPKDAKGLGLFARFPATPWGAVAARASTYWLKDSRYGGTLVVVPAFVVLAVVMYSQLDQPWILLALGPVVGWMLGFAISADISYDHSAFALHITSGVSGTADRVGRLIGLLSFGLPATVLAALIPALMFTEPVTTVALVGVSLGLLLGIAGFSCLVSARFTYPVPKPGDGPLSQPSGSTGRLMIVQLGMLVATLILMLPEVILVITWLLTDVSLWGWLLGIGAVLKGLALVWIGVRLGARVYERSQPELFQAVSQY
ncbi:transporter [Nesterenkonia sp. E16_7]|uniref:transporter n=1 Tax=unclassified Nesterenkonia TaxID=2629769 RepID=UPI001A92C350|nr:MULTISPECIES: transporter [unclassified Nesterenkonia]MBO0596178.1 transporter [Nesterenkonia sp. E16_10]MBO0598971.1 transporter [Nesterenkonia sp. E16_7]